MATPIGNVGKCCLSFPTGNNGQGSCGHPLQAFHEEFSFLEKGRKAGWRQCWGQEGAGALSSSVQLCHTKGILEVGGLLCLIFGEAGEDWFWLFRYPMTEILVRKFALVFLHAFLSKLTYLLKINH